MSAKSQCVFAVNYLFRLIYLDDSKKAQIELE